MLLFLVNMWFHGKGSTFKKVSQCLCSKLLINIQNLMGDQQQNRWVHPVGLLDHQLALVPHYLTKKRRLGIN